MSDSYFTEKLRSVFGLRLESYNNKLQSMGYSLDSINTDTTFSARLRGELNGSSPASIPENAKAQTPVLVDLVEQLTAQTNHGILDSMRKVETVVEETVTVQPHYDEVLQAELQTSRISGIACLIAAAIAVIVALFAFGTAFTQTVDSSVITTKIITLVALFAIAGVALWVNMRSRKTVQILLGTQQR